jgi:hypothetical protein
MRAGSRHSPGYINDAANMQQRFFATTQDLLAAIAVKFCV